MGSPVFSEVGGAERPTRTSDFTPNRSARNPSHLISKSQLRWKTASGCDLDPWVGILVTRDSVYRIKMLFFWLGWR